MNLPLLTNEDLEDLDRRVALALLKTDYPDWMYTKEEGCRFKLKWYLLVKRKNEIEAESSLLNLRLILQ